MKRQKEDSSSQSEDEEAFDRNSGKGSHNVETAENIKKSQPQPKRVAFFDAFTFIAVAAVIFFINLTSRSIIFDVVISAALLFKVLIGIFFYKNNNARSLRSYFIWRYTYNIFIIYPLIIILRYFTATYVLNYFLAGGIVLLFELIITLCYIKHLCKKPPLENIEDIPGFVLKSKRGNLTVMHIKSSKAGDYLIKSLGKKTAERIVQKKMKEQEDFNSRKKSQTKIKSGKQMTKIQQLEFRKEKQSKPRIGFNLIRSEEEIEGELEQEEIYQAKIENSQKFMSFQDRMSRDVVNDFILEEQAPKQKEKIQQVQDAREDIEKEREKMRRAFSQKQTSTTPISQIDNNFQESSNKNTIIKEIDEKILEKKTVKSSTDSKRDSVDQRTGIKDGPSPSNINQEDEVVYNSIKLNLKNNNNKDMTQNKIPINYINQQVIPRDQKSDDTIKEEDVEPQTERQTFDKLPRSNNPSLNRPVSHQQSQKDQNQEQAIADSKNKSINQPSITEKSNQIIQDTPKQNMDSINKNSEIIKNNKVINTQSNQQEKSKQNDQQQVVTPKQKTQQQEDDKRIRNSNTQQQAQDIKQQKEDKQKFKSYEEKFEIQRLQIQRDSSKTSNKQRNSNNNQQSSQSKQQSSSNGKHAYARNKIQQELQKKAMLKKQQEEQRRIEEEGQSGDSDDSDDSYYSDESPEARKKRKQAKQQKLLKQRTKKIHGVNDNNGESSSSLSENEDGTKKSKKKQTQNNLKVPQKQVRFDENRNTVKQLSSIDNRHRDDDEEEEDDYVQDDYQNKTNSNNYNQRTGQNHRDEEEYNSEEDNSEDY